MNGLDSLSGIEFEKLITVLLERMGFRTEMTKASGDGGIDVVATLDQPLTGGRCLIQCKRYAPDSPVGAATVREFYGALTADRRAVKGILITTSGFTAQALDFAEGLPIEVIGRDQLQRLLEQHGLHTDLIGTDQVSTMGEPPQPKDRASELLDLAIKMNEHGRGAEAIKLLREASQLQPDDPQVWLWLGICYNSVGLHDEAIAASREAVRLKPDFGQAWSWLGTGLRTVGEFDAAIEALTKALEIRIEDALTWVELGNAYREKGVKDRALLAYQRAVAVKPDDRNAWVSLDLFQYQQGNNTEALSAFREALRIDPNHAWSWKFLCHVYKNLGESARMHQALSRLEQLAPVMAREFRRDFR